MTTAQSFKNLAGKLSIPVALLAVSPSNRFSSSFFFACLFVSLYTEHNFLRPMAQSAIAPDGNCAYVH